MHPSVTPATPRDSERAAFTITPEPEREHPERERARAAHHQIMACAQNVPVALAAYARELAR